MPQIYLCLYFTFGYLRAYYGGSDFGSFFTQMSDIARNNPGLIAFQVLRGVLWAAIAFPIVRLVKGSRWQVGLAVALLFSVVVSDKLLLANPYMPESVRMTHLVEVASSNFLFGWAVVWLLRKRDAAGVAATAAQS
ncbi:MAG: hypothetical protein L0Z53_17440 [Acidobacteriales bacterium]|nr:hypothetical protein [Terriglobales bacterium]